MSIRLFVVACAVVALGLVAAPAVGDRPATLVKVLLRSGRSVVGELIEQSPERLKIRELKTGKETSFALDDLLKVDRDLADNDAIASAGLPAFVAWKLSREQVGPASGKIADVKPTAIYLTIGTKAGVEKGQKLAVYRDGATDEEHVLPDFVGQIVDWSEPAEDGDPLTSAERDMVVTRVGRRARPSPSCRRSTKTATGPPAARNSRRN
ncbi:MAG: hypothetical protein B7Z74_00980 [Deltaproteobacteria bacterium 21-66-5]|nr:MAG: hypothetical protein B7Z74_00980 [Deltaproteobacteria bacterium 21-66-5]